ncbi:hypothetical protein K2X85_01660 [bacterium]|nr:hypothetical protein [bacterium]
MDARRLMSWTLACLALFVLPRTSWGDKPPKKESGEESFIRIVRSDRGTPMAMETSVAHYSNGKEGSDLVTVDLLSAIHVGDRGYYEKLNEIFATYDALLYELVAPEGTTPANRPAEADSHPVALMQNGLKDLLGLDHQLAIVNYEKPNFVHADMSPDEFAKAMKDRGESFMTLFFRMALEGMKAQGENAASEGEDLRMLMAMMSPNRPLALKRILADQFSQLETISAGLDGPTGSAIVTDRNKRALAVLRKKIDEGKKKIGIFYGAAHMNDMQRHLLQDFNLKRTGTDWLVAWDMNQQAPPSDFIKRLEKNRKERGLDKKKTPATAKP